jgi:hypothetical protein
MSSQVHCKMGLIDDGRLAVKIGDSEFAMTKSDVDTLIIHLKNFASVMPEVRANTWRDIDGYWVETDAQFYEYFVSEKIPSNGIVVEIGCFKGRSSRCLYELNEKYNRNLKLWFVDTWRGSEEHQEIAEIKEDRVYDMFLENMAGRQFNSLRLASVEAADRFMDESIDFVFIDAAHDYDNVVADIKAWLPKVKQSGWITGHDWQHEPVRDAVADALVGKEVFTLGLCWAVQK